MDVIENDTKVDEVAALQSTGKELCRVVQPDFGEDVDVPANEPLLHGNGRAGNDVGRAAEALFEYEACDCVVDLGAVPVLLAKDDRVAISVTALRVLSECLTAQQGCPHGKTYE